MHKNLPYTHDTAIVSKSEITIRENAAQYQSINWTTYIPPYKRQKLIEEIMYKNKYSWVSLTQMKLRGLLMNQLFEISDYMENTVSERI